METKDNEINNPIIERNLRILERTFINKTTHPLDPKEEEIARSINQGERMIEDGTLYAFIKIKYKTSTGEIVYQWIDFDNSNIQDGEYSELRTYLVTDNEEKDDKKYKILLTYPEKWISPRDLNSAVNEEYGTGEPNSSLAEGRWILPQRIIPGQRRQHGSDVNGLEESWGKSIFLEKTEDMVLFNTIDEFNKKHGVSLIEQLFRKAGPISQ